MDNPKPGVSPESGFIFQKRTGLNRAVSNVGKGEVRPPRMLQRHQSLVAFEDLILCELCHKKLKDHRMLLCQHIFCLECLDTHFMASNTSVLQDKKKIDANFHKNTKFVKCPVCQATTPLDQGYNSIKELPKNMKVEMLLEIVENENDGPVPPTHRCAKCHIVGRDAGQNSCPHCMQDFCNICWSEHHSVLELNLNNLLKQLEECDTKLEHKMELYETHQEQLINFIESTTIAKIEEIKEREQIALDEVKMLRTQREDDKNAILERVEELIRSIRRKSISKSADKVNHYMNFHNETSKLLEDILHFGEENLHFNPETFKLEKSENIKYNLLQTSESHVKSRNKYKLKNASKPKLVWEKCPRPAHVAIPPWDDKKLYIAATDNKNVLVLNIDKLMLLETLSCPEMLYPQGLAFSFELQEIFVSDKWKHCIHVFSRDGEYLRSIGSKGNGQEHLKNPDGMAIASNNQLLVCDTGNDRVVVFDPKTGEYLSTLCLTKGLSLFNQPTDIAVKGEKIIVADCCNHRIKILNMEGVLLQEFGSHGNSSGQFRSPEVLVIDADGNILVGDSGNARIQIFEPNGNLLKVLGGAHNKFQSVSGICVSRNFDIIVTDNKSKCLRII